MVSDLELGVVNAVKFPQHPDEIGLTSQQASHRQTGSLSECRKTKVFHAQHALGFYQLLIKLRQAQMRRQDGMLDVKQPVVTRGNPARFGTPTLGARIRRVHADVNDLRDLLAPLTDYAETVPIPGRVGNQVDGHGHSQGTGKLERFEVLGSFPTAREAQDEIELAERPVDLIIAELAESSSEEVVELAATTDGAEAAGPTVVALIPNWRQGLVASLLRSGVSAVLPNTATGEEIIAAVEAALAGLVVLPRDALEIFEETPAAQDAIPESTALDREPLTETLTPRERQVLGMMAEGLGNKEIAWRLQISEHTVKFHVSSILAKLNASSRTEAVAQGLRTGLIMM